MKMRPKFGLSVSAWTATFAVVIALAASAMGFQSQATDPTKKDGDPRQARVAPERVKIAGIENAFRLSPRLYSGGQPEGAAALSALKGLGVKTIISVDGSRPNAEEARHFGIGYVHLPVGYDGIPREQALRIIKVVKTLEGPVFVHCHHGKHRGPAAAALCGIATEGWTREQAVAWMNQAGTSPDYRGLFASIREFAMPSAEELSRVGAELPERAKVAALVEAMVQIDEHWDHLKAVRAAGFKPDIDPSHEALQLRESFRELLRLDDSRSRGEDFTRAIEVSERLAADLESSLRQLAKNSKAESRKRADAAFVAVGKNCTACHARYRDN